MNYKLKDFFIYTFLIFTGICITITIKNELYAYTNYSECFSTCEKFTGQSKFNCLNLCLKTIKKKGYGNNQSVKNKIEVCKDICSVYTGIDNVKCLRICLDKNTGQDSGSNQKIEDDPKTKECKDRCKVLTGELKYKCLKKCLKSIK